MLSSWAQKKTRAIRPPGRVVRISHKPLLDRQRIDAYRPAELCRSNIIANRLAVFWAKLK